MCKTIYSNLFEAVIDLIFLRKRTLETVIVKTRTHKIIIFKAVASFNNPEKENFCGKRRKCWKPFSFCPTMLSKLYKINLTISGACIISMLSAITSYLVKSQIWLYGKKLPFYQTKKFGRIENMWLTCCIFCFSDMVENFVGKEENAGSSIFSLSYNIFLWVIETQGYVWQG